MAEVERWPQMVELIERLNSARSLSCLEYPVLAARAYGRSEEKAFPAATAMFCALTSINLVDDMLDEDPRGDHLRWGEGVAANLALAFQAAGFRILEQADAETETRCAAMSSLASMLIGTSHGQHLDLGTFDDEEGYWSLVAAKTAPLFRCSLFMGARLAGVSEAEARRVQRLGDCLGKIVQVNDDIADALATPAKPDWRPGSANLALLYASLAKHPDRARFIEIRERVSEARVLAEAQAILVRSGAVSFCLYHVVETYREAVSYLSRELQLIRPACLCELLEDHLRPLRSMLRRLGIKTPSDLALS